MFTIIVFCSLKNLLVNRLIESGWNDKVRILCRDAVAEETALITVEEISAKVTNSARQLIPDIVKKELLQSIKNTLLRLDTA